MRIVSFNVNGLRALERKGLLSLLFVELRPDILLLQETKSTEEQLPLSVKNIPYYHSFFNASQMRKGYSGTALYTKKKPLKVEYGMNVPKYDKEGRLITAFFPTYTVIGGYFPNGGQGPERLEYKLGFYDAFLSYIEKLKKKGPVIWGGDVNTAHHPIDLARPKNNEKNTGFLPIERAWLDKVEKKGWIDTFRSIYPEKKEEYTYWDIKTRSRERNVGWRLDYLFVSKESAKKIKKVEHHTSFLGSDHCPLFLDISL
jgi:exodeoxyribonuclease III